MEIVTRDKNTQLLQHREQRRHELPDVMRAWGVYAAAFLELVTPTGNEAI